MKYHHIIFVSILFFSCNNKTEDNKNESSFYGNSADTAVVNTITSDDDANTTLIATINIDSLRFYMNKATQLREDLERRLIKSTPPQADSIYWNGDFWFTETEEFEHVNRLTEPAITRWGLNGGEIGIMQDSEVFELLSKEGIEPEYMGEGYAELRINAYYYYNLFKPYLSEEHSEFLKLTADNDYIIEMDAGLIIPLDSLVSKCIRWEKYLNKYPNVEQRKMIVSQYGFYMALIMFCTYDNTRAFDYYTKEADRYVVETVENAVKKYPDSQTSNIFKQYLNELKKSDFKYSKQIEDKIMAMGILKDFDRTDIYY